MKKSLPFLALLALTMVTHVFAQTKPIVYINFVSHNEPYDTLENQYGFNKMNTKVLQLAAIIKNKNASWNLETCDGYPYGALKYQDKTANIFKTLATTYAANIEVDPRPKVTSIAGFPTHNSNTWNIADTYHILDSLGANPSHTLGGFVYGTEDKNAVAIDWFTYQNEVVGKTYKSTKWKAQMMWGAGSYKPHTNDLNDWGIFKPDTVSYTSTQASFLKHNPNRGLWYIGNGCQPIYALDSTEDETIIIDEIRSFLDDIQNNVVPLNKFYVYSVTINQSGFGPTLFGKISRICDSVNSWGTNKIQWKTLSQKFSAFQTWQSTSGLDYSQWLCGQTATNIDFIAENNSVQIYPNPTNENCTIQFSDNAQHTVSIVDLLGTIIYSSAANNHLQINLNGISDGIYIVKVDGHYVGKIIKQ